MDIPAKLLWRMASGLTAEERGFVRWLAAGCPLPHRETPPRLVDRAYVAEDLGGPMLTPTGTAIARLLESAAPNSGQTPMASLRAR